MPPSPPIIDVAALRAGAILLLVVDSRVGDIEAVRDVIAGEEIALATETEKAIGGGLAWIHAWTTALAVGCVLAGVTLARRARELTPSLGRVRTE